jgi:hypothetical protein
MARRAEVAITTSAAQQILDRFVHAAIEAAASG